jgi:hypothetical protein
MLERVMFQSQIGIHPFESVQLALDVFQMPQLGPLHLSVLILPDATARLADTVRTAGLGGLYLFQDSNNLFLGEFRFLDAASSMGSLYF